MEPYRLIAYDLQTGVRICRLDAKTVSWSHSWNEAGGMNATLVMSRDMADLDLSAILLEQRTALALWRGPRLLHAGPVTVAPEWDPSDGTLRVTCGGGLTCLEWLPAMDSRLRDRTFDGTVTIDETNPDPGLYVGFGGSAGDIVKGWIGLAQQWAGGRLPIDVPLDYTATRRDLVVNAAAWDFKTIADMIGTTLDLQSGGQLRFDPSTGTDGRLRWTALWNETGITDHAYRWNPALPGQRVRFTGVAAGTGPAVTDAWASGGKNNDTLMLARIRDTTALDEGWPLVFRGDTSTGSTDSLAALHAACRANLTASRRDRTWKLSVGLELDPHVGDHVTLRVDDPYLHERLPDGRRVETEIPLLITDVSGSTDSEWTDVQCRQYTGSIDGIRPGAGDPFAATMRRFRALSRGTRLAQAAGGSQVYATTSKMKRFREDS